MHKKLDAITTAVSAVLASWNVTKTVAEKPICILTGGYPGSGKTELLRELQKRFAFVIISGDVIRSLLLEKNAWEDNELSNLVDQVTLELVVTACKKHLSLAIDREAQPLQLLEIREFLEEHGFLQYKIITLLCQASEATLLKRAGSTTKASGLSAKLAGQYDPKQYDIVISTDTMNAKKAATTVLHMLTTGLS